MFLTGLNLTCSNLKTLRKTSNHGAINPIDHAHKLTRQFHVHAVFNTFHPHKHPLWTHKRTSSALNTVWHEIFARSNFGEFSRDPQRFFQRYNFKSAVKCSCPCLTCPKTYDTKTNAVMFNALALLSFYVVLEPRDSCNYPFFYVLCHCRYRRKSFTFRWPNLTFHERRKKGWSRTSDSPKRKQCTWFPEKHYWNLSDKEEGNVLT